METGTKILTNDEVLPNLHPTPPPQGQTYCAFTYLLVKDPKTPEYGILKVLCTGSTKKEVETTVATMMKSGELEPEIPFVSIRRTGYYTKIVAGGDPAVPKDNIDVQTGEVVNEIKKEAAEKRKKEMKEMERRLDDLAESSKEKADSASDSFETYKYHRVQAMMVTQRIAQLETELKEVQKVKKKAATKIVQLEREFGTYPHRFEKEMEKNRQAHKEQMELARAKLLAEENASVENDNNK